MELSFIEEDTRERIALLRSTIADIESYDIFLAQDISDAEKGKQKIPLYDSVESLCARLGHKAFVPYKFVKLGDPDEMVPRNAYILINDIMIPQSSLILCYLGINSADAGVMDARAKILGKNIIYFYEQDAALETVDDVQHKVLGVPLETGLVARQMPRVFLHRDSPSGELYRYSRIKGIVKFDSIEDCVKKLEPKIKACFNHQS